MYMSYLIGQQAYIYYLSVKFPGSYIEPATPIKDKAKKYVVTVVREVLNDKEV